MPEKFEIRPLRDEPLGAEIVGVSGALDFDDGQINELKAALASYHGLVIRGAPRQDDCIIRLAQRFGMLLGTPGLDRPAMMELTHNTAHPAHALKANDFEWHTDGINYEGVIGKETFLEALQVVKNGGHTYLVSTYEIYDSLPPALKARLDGVLAVHDSQQYKKQAGFSELGRPAVHPLVTTHPDSGKRCLFFTPYTTVGFLGLPPAEGNELLLTLMEKILEPGRIYKHKWQVGDLLLFDILGTWHRRDGWDPARETRRMKMCSTWYEAPVFPLPADAPDADPTDESQYRYDAAESDLDQRTAALSWARRQIARNRAKSSAG